MKKWTDTTSYSRGDKERTPQAWTLKLKHLEICVHRHIHYPGEWFVRCRELDVDMHVLVADEEKAAKFEAVEYLQNVVAAYASDLELPCG